MTDALVLSGGRPGADALRDSPLVQRIVRDERVLTSRGPGTALEFALALVSVLCGAGRAAEVAAPLIAKDPPPVAAGIGPGPYVD